MGGGQTQQVAGQCTETLALIALTSEAGLVSASYKIAEKATTDERRVIADKLWEIARVVRG